MRNLSKNFKASFLTVSIFLVIVLGLVWFFSLFHPQEKSLKTANTREKIDRGETRMEKGKILMIIAPENFRDEEYLKPKKIFEANGFEVDTASTRTGKAVGMLGTEVEVNKIVYELSPDEYDAVVLVGGIGAQVFFEDEKIHEFLRTAYEEGKIVAAICISPVTLAKAGLLKGKRATVWPSEAEVLKKYGAKYTGNAVEVDGNIVTANGPEAAEQFGETIVKLLTEKASD